MYPFFRFGKTIVQAALAERQGNTLTLDDVGEVRMRCSLTDIDNFLEMNNGRILTLFDMGRTDFAIRSGLGKMLLKKRWGLVVAGSSAHYRKRVRAFDEVVIKTRIVGIDERWIYVEQSMWLDDTPCSSALLRTGVTKGGKVLDTQTVLEAMGKPDWKKPPEQWVQEWIDSERHRPWPPQV